MEVDYANIMDFLLDKRESSLTNDPFLGPPDTLLDLSNNQDSPWDLDTPTLKLDPDTDMFLDNLLKELDPADSLMDCPPLLEPIVDAESPDEHSYASTGLQLDAGPSSPDSGNLSDCSSRLSPFSASSHRSSVSDSSEVAIDILQSATDSIFPAAKTTRPRVILPKSSRSSVRVLPYTNKDLSPGYRHPVSNSKKYPALNLNIDERRLIEKEGIVLPSHYPLTKAEERELKRVRRKIRNKCSAQESRKRKAIYVDDLEHRVETCTRENQTLKKQVHLLASQNKSLVDQLKKLKSAVANGSRRTAQAGTCLAVLLLSFALLVAPNLSPFNKADQNVSEQQTAATEARGNQPMKRAPLAGRSRTLLHALPPAPSPLVNEEELLEHNYYTESTLSSNKRQVVDGRPLTKRIKIEPLDNVSTELNRLKLNATKRNTKVYIGRQKVAKSEEL